MQHRHTKFIALSVLAAVLMLGLAARVALAATYSSFNDCVDNNNTYEECCAMSQFTSDTADCGSTNVTKLVDGSPCVSSPSCTSGNCSNGVCALPGTSGAGNLCGGVTCSNGNSCDSATGLCTVSGTTNSSGGSNPICDTSNGYTMKNGLCIPNSPFSGGLASQSTLSGLIKTILNIILTLSGIIAVIFIIIGGFQYMTAGGNEEQAEKGRKALTNAIIGLLIVILAFTIVQVVTNTLTSASPIGISNVNKV